MRDLVFHERLCLHFNSKSVLREFVKIHPRFTIGENEKNHQSFKEVHLALHRADDSAIQKLQHIKLLYGVSFLYVYLLQSPGMKVLNKESIHRLDELLRDKFKDIRIRHFSSQPISLERRFHYDTNIGLGLEIWKIKKEIEKESGGYTYDFPHEHCKLAPMLDSLDLMKQAYRAIHGDIVKRQRR